MDKKIIKLLPEIELFKDQKLRDKVVAVYQRALKEGGCSAEDMGKIPFTLLLPTKISYLEHTRAVTQVCLKTYQTYQEIYGQRSPLNFEILLAGALLHDVGKLVEYKSGKETKKSDKGKLLRHPFIGVGLCYAEELPYEVMNIIALHSHEGDRGGRTPEGSVLHHADFINFEPFK